MTRRSIILGLLLGLFVAGFSYVNDAMVRGTFLIGNFLPIGVLGPVLLLLFLLNPLWAWVTRRSALSGREIAIGAAIGLAACSWPGSSFYRVATGVVALPQHLINFEPSWQANELMSYLPQASHRIAPGQISDGVALARLLSASAGADQETTPAAHLYARLNAAERVVFNHVASAGTVSGSEMQQMAQALNRLLHDPSLSAPASTPDASPPAKEIAEFEEQADWMRFNRAWLAESFPEHILPAPRGAQVLLDNSDEARVIAPLLEGRPDEDRWSLRQLPWDVWWPTIHVWGGTALALALATLCLTMIVHRQWSRNELLSYPVARFVSEVTETDPGSYLPRVAKQKIFWIGFALVFAHHLWSGAAVWNPAIPRWIARVDLTPLMSLFPNAREVSMARQGLFSFPLHPSVIAFAFFLDSRISLSLGLTNFFWVIFGAALVANGIPLEHSYAGALKGNLLRIGAYTGFTGMIIYTGRRYYAEAMLRTFGLRRNSDLPTYVRWAGRGFLVGIALTILGLYAAGMNVIWSVLFILFILMTFLVMSRIVAESGFFFLQPAWLPVAAVTAFFGFEALGPTHYILLLLASALLAGDSRTTLMPYLINGLKLMDIAPRGGERLGRCGAVLLLMILASFITAGLVTLYFQYNHGMNRADAWAFQGLSRLLFSGMDQYVSDLAARGDLSAVTSATAGGRIGAFTPEAGAYFWALIGAGLVISFALARLRLTWWPFHPIIFLVWGTMPIARFGGSFLIGWAIKQSIVKTMGARGFHAVKPLMIGIVAAELFSVLFWSITSLIYYLNTGLPPEPYRIFN